MRILFETLFGETKMVPDMWKELSIGAEANKNVSRNTGHQLQSARKI